MVGNTASAHFDYIVGQSLLDQVSRTGAEHGAYILAVWDTKARGNNVITHACAEDTVPHKALAVAHFSHVLTKC